MCVISDHVLLSEVTHIYYTNQYNLSAILHAIIVYFLYHSITTKRK